MAIEDVPILKWDVRCMLFWSQIRHHNYKRYIITVPFTMLNIFQWLYLILDWHGELENMMFCIYFTFFFSTVLPRLYMPLINGKKFTEILEAIEFHYNQMIVSFIVD